jgi:hypothetical protein
MGYTTLADLDAALYRAWNNSDASQVVLLCTPDIVWHDLTIYSPAVGLSAVQTFLQERMDALSQPNYQKNNFYYSENMFIASWYSISGVNKKPITFLQEWPTIPAHDKPVSTAGFYAAIVEPDESGNLLFAQVYTYTDYLTLMVNVGFQFIPPS